MLSRVSTGGCCCFGGGGLAGEDRALLTLVRGLALCDGARTGGLTLDTGVLDLVTGTGGSFGLGLEL